MSAFKNTYYPSEHHIWHHERTGDAVPRTPKEQTMTPLLHKNSHFSHGDTAVGVPKVFADPQEGSHIPPSTCFPSGEPPAGWKDRSAYGDSHGTVKRIPGYTGHIVNEIGDPPPEAEPFMTIYPRVEGSRLVNELDQHFSAPAAIAVPVYSHGQLTRMSKRGIQLVARELRDRVGEAVLPPLSLNQQQEITVQWILDVQVLLARATGLEVTVDQFGIPVDYLANTKHNADSRGASSS